LGEDTRYNIEVANVSYDREEYKKTFSRIDVGIYSRSKSNNVSGD